MKKPVLAGIIVVAVILLLMVYGMLNLTSHRVEVCMEFGGKTNCKTASGATQEDALRAAETNACAEIAFGVTDTMACGRAEPVKMTVLK
jgi:hypothetical protein